MYSNACRRTFLLLSVALRVLQYLVSRSEKINDNTSSGYFSNPQHNYSATEVSKQPWFSFTLIQFDLIHLLNQYNQSSLISPFIL